MKIISNTTRYRCDHCGKEYKMPYPARNHEDRCGKNPINHPACTDCMFLKETHKLIDSGDSQTPPYYSKSFHCEKKDIGLYPRKVVYKKILDRYPELFKGEILMPVKCDDCFDKYPW
jgi:hypothetical protein